MSLQELRAQIIEDVQAINDEKALQEVLDTLHCFPPFAGDHSNALYNPTPEQWVAIQEGLADVRAGRTISEEEADNEIAEWLNSN